MAFSKSYIGIYFDGGLSFGKTVEIVDGLDPWVEFKEWLNHSPEPAFEFVEESGSCRITTTVYRSKITMVDINEHN